MFFFWSLKYCLVYIMAASVSVNVNQWYVLLYPTNTISGINVINISIIVHVITHALASPRTMYFFIKNRHISLCWPKFTTNIQLWHIYLLVASFIYLHMFLPMRNALKYTFKFSSILLVSGIQFRFYFLIIYKCSN